MAEALRILFVHAWRGFSLAEWSLEEALASAGARVDFRALDVGDDPSPLSDLLPRTVAAQKPDVVGFSCHAWTLPTFLEAAGWVKELRPGARVVLGGPQVSHPRTAEVILSRHAAVDFVVRGPGERPLVGLAEALCNLRDLDTVPGLSRRAGGRTVHAPPDHAPWRRGLVFHAGHRRAGTLEHAEQASYETTRGCRGACTYCVYRATPRGELDLDLVRRELAFLCSLRIGHLRICDAELGGSAGRAKAILAHLARVNAGTSVKVHAGLGHVDAEYVGLLRDANAVVTSIGVQTTNPRALAAIRRRSSFERAEAIRLLLDAFPETPADVIAGLPGDDPEGFARTLRDVLDAGFAALNVYPLVAFPGTELGDDVAAALGGDGIAHTSRGIVLSSAAFPREAREEVACLAAAAEVAAPLVRTRRALGPRSGALLELAHRLDARDLLELQRAVKTFRPGLLLARAALVAAVTAERDRERAGGEALSEDLAELLLRLARRERRRTFTWLEPGGAIREIDRVAFPARRGRLLLDLDAGVIRLREAADAGAAVLTLGPGLAPLPAEARA